MLVLIEVTGNHKYRTLQKIHNKGIVPALPPDTESKISQNGEAPGWYMMSRVIPNEYDRHRLFMALRDCDDTGLPQSVLYESVVENVIHRRIAHFVKKSPTHIWIMIRRLPN